LVIENTDIKGNFLTGARSNNGAGIFAGTTATLNNVNVLNNFANVTGSNGGGIYKSRSTGSGLDLFINGGTVIGNQAYQGGGVYLGNTSTLVSSGAITTNIALEGVAGSGGGVWCASADNVEISAGSVIGNTPDEISCIANADLSKVIVKKVTDPGTSTNIFDFSTNYGDGFNLGNGQLNDSGPLAPTSENGGVPYSVSESVPEGWILVSTTCSDGSDSAAIELSAGEIVTCTFQNLKKGKIIVEKFTDPGTSTEVFGFSTNYGEGQSPRAFLKDGYWSPRPVLTAATRRPLSFWPVRWSRVRSRTCKKAK